MFAPYFSHIGVLTLPGSTKETLTPQGLSSMRSASVRASRPNLDAQ